MNIFTIILNRTYRFLTKVKNQSPFLGAIIIVGLLLNTLVDILITLVYLLMSKSNNNEILYYFIWAVITFLVYLYARKRKTQITEVNLSAKSNFLVAGVFLFALISVIWCGGINRERLSKEKTNTAITKPRKESLERKIRRLFD